MLFSLIYLYFYIEFVSSLLPTLLLDNYDKRVNPFYITNKTVLVKFTIPSITLEQVVSQENQATFLYGLNVEWIDPRLAFDPQDFGGHTELLLPASEIWRPAYKISDTFPFDIQFCAVEIENTLANISMMRFQGYRAPDQGMKGNNEFRMINYTVLTLRESLIEETNTLFFVATLERKTYYFIFVIVLPAILVTTLTITGVLTSGFGEPTGDPVTIGLTSMLALSITLSVVADNVPKAATVPLIGWFVIVCLTLCILSVFFGVILNKCRSTNKRKNDKIIKRISIFLLSLFQLSLAINVIVFFSFSWNHDEYSLIDLFLDKYDVTG